MMAAAARRDLAHGDAVSFSPKAFIPLTRLCRDVCHYCVFARPPRSGERAFLAMDEVLAIARTAKAAGCHEALFTLGDKPELRYRAARDELASMGHETTLSYLAEAAEAVLRETGLFPHINAGVMSAGDVAALRKVSISQGMMLETTAERLSEKGGPHFGSPDKAPDIRLAAIRAAGEAAVPFTSGLLIGIGETREERIEALLALRDLNDAHGHIQEIIIQNFAPKPGTRMANSPPSPLEEHLWTIAAARLIFDPDMNIQAPPNLSAGRSAPSDRCGHQRLGRRFAGDAGPRESRSALAAFRHVAARDRGGGQASHRSPADLPALYKRNGALGGSWLAAALLRAVDGEGWPRTDDWSSGAAVRLPAAADLAAYLEAPSYCAARFIGSRARRRRPQPERSGDRLPFSGTRPRFRGRLLSSGRAARQRQRHVRNLRHHPEHQLHQHLRLCAVSSAPSPREDRRASARQTLQPAADEIDELAREAWRRGATEVCMQGGIHPSYTGATYLDIVRTVKAAVPGIHLHAFSPLEVHQGAATLGLPLGEYLSALKAAGLGSLPGTAAEILDDEVRASSAPTRSARSAGWRSCAPRTRPGCARPPRSCSAISTATSIGRVICCASGTCSRRPAASPRWCRCPSCIWKRRSI